MTEQSGENACPCGQANDGEHWKRCEAAGCLKFAGHCPEHDDERVTPAPPMVEAGDLFDRFWNAMVREDDWQAAFPEWPSGCDCGNCRVCGVRYALSWTAALFSNPGLADHAERRKAERHLRPAGQEDSDA